MDSLLRSLTSARVGLGRCGSSLPTREVLRFQAAHALARDAVHCSLDIAGMSREIEAGGWKVAALHSEAPDRTTYLRRPDLGRKLSAESRALLEHEPADLAIVIADGLSAMAVHRHAVGLLRELLPHCAGWSILPMFLVEQGRVAISDDIGAATGARMVLMLIGERPGLSSPDSLGAYLTFDAKPGCTDAQRNCLSNIHSAGVSYQEAAQRIWWLMGVARRIGGTGFLLKEGTGHSSVGHQQRATLEA